VTTPDQPTADYTAQALRTESPTTPALQTRLQQQARLVHAVLGLQTEAGELADPVKKHIYYGRPLDPVNLREEIGDCLWYLAIACDALGTTIAAEQARNLAKLRTRFPHVFTAEAAQVRDLDREREVLEGANLKLNTVFVASTAEVIELRGQLVKLRAFVGKVRSVSRGITPATSKLRWICDALTKLDEETTEPAPVAEPLDGEGGA
jgi:NTP pyrophosphatase (non-canonical NTP hydrolase)